MFVAVTSNRYQDTFSISYQVRLRLGVKGVNIWFVTIVLTWCDTKQR